MSTFEARYRGRCANCDESIHPGDTVTYVDDELVHAACDVWRAACRIETVEQLDALPPLSVILTKEGQAAQRVGGPSALVDGWFPSAGLRPVTEPARMLPALLIWHPRWAR